MPKQKISAKELAADIRSGMDDTALMAKYQLSRDGLHDVYDKLITAGLITRAEIYRAVPSRKSSNKRPVSENKSERRLPRWATISLLIAVPLAVAFVCLVLFIVLRLWPGEDVSLHEGAYILTEDALAARTLADYDRLTKILDPYDEKAFAEFLKNHNVPLIKKGSTVEVIGKRRGTNAVKIKWRYQYSLEEFWLPEGVLKDPNQPPSQLK